MAVGHVQNWTGVSSATGSATITGTAVTAGNWMVAAVRYVSGQSVDVVPSPFTSAFSRNNAPDGSTVLEVFIGKAVGGETSFEFGDSGTNMSVALTELSAILATAPTDVSASSESVAAAGCSTGVTAATAQADSMALAFFCTSGGNVTSPSCADANGGAAYTLGSFAIVGAIHLYIAYKVLAATSTQEGTWSWTTARVSASGILVLKGLAPGGGGGGGVNGSAQWTEQRRR